MYIPLHDFNLFRTHSDDLDVLIQTEDVKVENPRSFLPPTAPVCQLTPAEMVKKITNRHSSMFSKFKEIDAWPSRSPSRSNSSEGTASSSKLEPNSSNYSDLNSDSLSLASNREESNSLLV